MSLPPHPSRVSEVFGDQFYVEVAQPSHDNLIIRVTLWSEGHPSEASKDAASYSDTVTKNIDSVQVLNIHVENQAPLEVDSWAAIGALHETFKGLLPELQVIRLAVHHSPSSNDPVHDGLLPYYPLGNADFHPCPFTSLFGLPMLQTLKGYRLRVTNLGRLYDHFTKEETLFQNTKELGVLFATDGASANRQLWSTHELCVLFPFVAWSLPNGETPRKSIMHHMDRLVKNVREWNELRKWEVGMKGWDGQMLDEY